MENLRRMRKERKLSLKELGNVIGVAESTISLYESGRREPDYATLIRIAEYFGVTTDYLLGRTKKTGSIRESIPAPTAEHIVNRLTDEECNLVFCYRQADPGTQAAIRKLLDIPEAQARYAPSEKAI